jgi:hypothetical protein
MTERDEDEELEPEITGGVGRIVSKSNSDCPLISLRIRATSASGPVIFRMLSHQLGIALSSYIISG